METNCQLWRTAHWLAFHRVCPIRLEYRLRRFHRVFSAGSFDSSQPGKGIYISSRRKLLRYGIGTLTEDDLRAIQKTMRHAENRMTEMELGIRHDVTDLKSYQRVVNSRVDNFIEYLNQTNTKLRDTLRHQVSTSEEVTHLKNLL